MAASFALEAGSSGNIARLLVAGAFFTLQVRECAKPRFIIVVRSLPGYVVLATQKVP